MAQNSLVRNLQECQSSVSGFLWVPCPRVRTSYRPFVCSCSCLEEARPDTSKHSGAHILRTINSCLLRDNLPNGNVSSSPLSNFSDPTCGQYGGVYNANNDNCCADTCLMDGEPRCQWDSGACVQREGGRAGCCPGNIANNAPVCGVDGAVAPCNSPGEA